MSLSFVEEAKVEKVKSHLQLAVPMLCKGCTEKDVNSEVQTNGGSMQGSVLQGHMRVPEDDKPEWPCSNSLRCSSHPTWCAFLR